MHVVDTPSVRRRAAAAARALIAGQIEWDDFAADFGDAGDPRVAELFDLMAHEPEVGGFWGVSRLRYRVYRAAIERLIAELERET